MLKRIAITSIFILLASCKSDSSDTPAQSKELFSIWTASDNSVILNLDTFDFGTFSTTLTLSSGEICTFDFTISGSQSSGSYTIANSVYTSGGGGDPGCADLNAVGTYTNSNAKLTACDSGCVDYY